MHILELEWKNLRNTFKNKSRFPPQALGVPFGGFGGGGIP